MYVYYDHNNQVAMLAESKIDAPNFTELEVDDNDPAIINQKTNGGQLSVKNGIITYSPLENIKPIDVMAEVQAIASEAKDFKDFQNKLATKLTK